MDHETASSGSSVFSLFVLFSLIFTTRHAAREHGIGHGNWPFVYWPLSRA